MKLLIIYGSTEGHTLKIAKFLQAEGRKLGIQVSLAEANQEIQNLRDADAIVVAASIHAGQYKNEIVDFVSKNASVLNNVPSVFYSVGLTIVSKDKKAVEDLKHMTSLFLEITKWRPWSVEQIGGALQYSKYGFFKKMLIRSIMKKAGGDTDTSRDYEYTNWESLKESFQNFVGKLEAELV